MTQRITLELNEGIAFKLKVIMAEKGLFDKKYAQEIIEELIRENFDNLCNYFPEFVKEIKEYGFKRAFERKK